MKGWPETMGKAERIRTQSARQKIAEQQAAARRAQNMLGAQACLIGRPWAYALAARGQDGVAHVLELFRKQMTTTLVLAGCDDVRKIGTGMLA